jgi:biotin operon repressor
MADAKVRAQMLKSLREQHQETVATTQAHVKAIQATRKKICAALHSKALTIPELAEAAGLPSDQVLWHIAALRKYGFVVEVDQDGGYYRYAQVEETGK